MASQGELSYHHFILKLVQKANTRYISISNVQSIGSCFWGLLSDEFKQGRRQEEKRNAFWNFALFLKECILRREIDELYELWNHFDTNGKNMFENLYENCISHHVNNVL